MLGGMAGPYRLVEASHKAIANVAAIKGTWALLEEVYSIKSILRIPNPQGEGGTSRIWRNESERRWIPAVGDSQFSSSLSIMPSMLKAAAAAFITDRSLFRTRQALMPFLGPLSLGSLASYLFSRNPKPATFSTASADDVSQCALRGGVSRVMTVTGC